MKKLIMLALMGMISISGVQAKDVWVNNLRNDFLNHSTVIYAINLRTFNANDVDGNGIIDFENGENSGDFLNAIDRLPELKSKGVTALHVLPITPVGKMKALGTAGSLYSISDFGSLNPQLKNPASGLSIEEQATKFVQAAHDLGIAVIVDVPACGSYDLFLQRPELFVKDASGKAVIPADWTDVRLLNSGDENHINSDVFKAYKSFVDLMLRLGVDGIRVDVAHSKPARFWKELIEYSRKVDKQFLWLAESSNSWKDAVSNKAVYTPYDKLLEAGFDGYYGSYFNMKSWDKSKDLENQVMLDFSLEKKFGTPKSVIGSFTTHDELSPVLEKGANYSKMIMWLNATLPVNSYFVDGFDTGDKYLYFWANKKAGKTYTDDDYYFVHRGKIDIFNFSRKPGGNNPFLQEEFVRANQAKTVISEIYKGGTLKFLKTSSPSTFAYIISNKIQSAIVIGNMNFRNPDSITVSVPKLKQGESVIPLTLINAPAIGNGKITTDLADGEIQVLLFDKFTPQQ